MQINIDKKEADLTAKQNTKALEDLFSKSTDEIVDGLVQAADGDHELALKSLEQYMNTHDGFNRNILSAHQKLQNKVESMKNSKFNKMIGEALIKFKEDNERENQVYEVASSFANKNCVLLSITLIWKSRYCLSITLSGQTFGALSTKQRLIIPKLTCKLVNL